MFPRLNPQRTYERLIPFDDLSEGEEVTRKSIERGYRGGQDRELCPVESKKGHPQNLENAPCSAHIREGICPLCDSIFITSDPQGHALFPNVFASLPLLWPAPGCSPD